MQVFAWDAGDGDGKDIVDGDDDGEVFLDAFKGALDTGEEAVCYADFFTGLAGETEILEHHDVLVSAVYDADEVFHLLVGYVCNPGYGLERTVTCNGHDVAQVAVLGVVCLELTELPECGAEEYIVHQRWGVGIVLGTDQALGYVGLVDCCLVGQELVELTLPLDAGMEYPHGIPSHGCFS